MTRVVLEVRAAGNLDALPRDKRVSIGNESHYHRRNVSRLADSTEHTFTRELGGHRVGHHDPVSPQLGAGDGPRGYHVGSDSPRTEFGCEVTRENLHCRPRICRTMNGTMCATAISGRALKVATCTRSPPNRRQWQQR